MTNKSATTNLALADFEGTASRSLLLKLSFDQIEGISRSGILALGHNAQEIQVWEQILAGDLVLCFSLGDNSKLLACKITGRGIIPPNPTDPLRIKEEHPLLLFLQVIGETTSFKIKNEAFFFIESKMSPPRAVFQQLWEQCRILSEPLIPALNNKAWICTGRSGYEIKIASSHEDYLYIARMAAHHPFGTRNALLSLLAFHESEPLGAILVERAKNILHAHRAAWRIFRRDYSWIRARAVNIVRIYTSPKAPKRFGLHRALVEAALETAPAIVEQPLSIIEGVSYNYHPLALEFGFHVAVPNKLEDSFYYWKAFNIPPPMPATDRVKIRASIKEVLTARRIVGYWFAYGRAEDIELGNRKGMWAIRKQHPNTGRWNALQQGNIIFLLTRDDKIRSYGVVAGKENKRVANYEHFPLLISFAPHMVTDLDVDVSAYVKEDWFKRIEGGGITPLPDEFGATIKALADEQRKDGKMWVEPNPYILHKTDFDVVHGQIFVVQAWDLRDTVYPMIKSILETDGYKVTYSGDRDGQLVFEDIWLMLNESEAILVDFTFRRPNVYLEYGMALVLGKPIIAITQSKDDIPSDTPNLKYIFYQDKLGDQALQRQLSRAIRDVVSDIHMMKSRRRAGASIP